MLVEMMAKETSFKVGRGWSNPETRHGDPVPRGTAIPWQNFAGMELERWHEYPCHAARPCHPSPFV